MSAFCLKQLFLVLLFAIRIGHANESFRGHAGAPDLDARSFTWIDGEEKNLA
jgi:hypothetical protein